MIAVKPQIEPLPPSMVHLPIDPGRGYPVPWFVAWVDGKPEFRMADGAKLATAVQQDRCWVCGRRNDPGRVTFLVGPMCGVNRVSAEPPSHLVCARYSAKNCPFLSKPGMVRRDHEAVAAAGTCAGEMIARNPGVSLLWTTTHARTFGDGKGGVLFHLAEPTALECWAEGRPATPEEVERSILTGLPKLEQLALADGPEACEALARMVTDFNLLLGRFLLPPAA